MSNEHATETRRFPWFYEDICGRTRQAFDEYSMSVSANCHLYLIDTPNTDRRHLRSEVVIRV